MLTEIRIWMSNCTNNIPRFTQGENSFQIRNSLKWNLTKERSDGEALIQRRLASPLYEAATHVR